MSTFPRSDLREPKCAQPLMIGLSEKQTRRWIDTGTIAIDCSAASRVGTWTGTLTDPATGKVRDVQARYSFIYRFEGGDWQVDHLHSSAMPEA